MLRRGDAGLLYVFCNDPGGDGTRLSGTMPRDKRGVASPVAAFADTWTPDQDPGGGSGPTVGLYRPVAGFGKVWREDRRVRDCLGYALRPDAVAYTQRYQPFRFGAMLSLALPEGRFIYAMLDRSILTPNACTGPATDCRSQFVRYPDPRR